MAALAVVDQSATVRVQIFDKIDDVLAGCGGARASRT